MSPLLPAARDGKLETHRHELRASQIMREFFRGWKRKLGVVTLVIACLFMGVWLRSHAILDRITLFTRHEMFERISVRQGQIALFSTAAHPAQKSPEWASFNPVSGLFPWEDELQRGQGNWRWRFFGIGVWEYKADHDWWSKWYVLQCRTIVYPLTLLSAWLLLSKPRPAKQTESPITTAN